MEFFACTLHFSAGLHFMCSLALSCEVLLNCKVDHMLIGLYSENIVWQINSSSCLLTFYI